MGLRSLVVREVYDRCERNDAFIGLERTEGDLNWQLRRQ